MKVTAVIGGPHRNGNTAKLARAVLKGLEDSGFETCELFLPDYRIDYCMGCMGHAAESCMSTGRCRIEDDVPILLEKLLESDGIILASPAYGRRPYAMMKNFLVDRIGMYSAYTSRFAGKYFAGVATAGGIGGGKVARELAGELSSDFHARSYRCGHIGIHVGNGRIDDQKRGLEKAYRLGLKMASDILNKRTFPFQNILKRILFKVFVRRLILNNIYSNRTGSLKAVYENLTKRGLIAAK